MSLSLFAVKKAIKTNNLSIENIPADLKEKLATLPDTEDSNEAVDEIDPFIPPSGSWCAIV